MKNMLIEWSDARLNDLALALMPLPTKVAALTEAVEHLDGLAVRLQSVPSQVAVLTATVERLTEDNRALRQELATTQHQLLQIAWGLVAALIGAGGALIVTFL
jgi:outer membrane murein-binding lipoprotein Lpp